MKGKLVLVVFLLTLVLLIEVVISSRAIPSPIPETRKPEGTLVVGLQTFGGENFLVPYSPQETYRILLSSWEFLVRRQPDGSLVPGLATQWKMLDKGETWTFDLRKGVPFHDGWGEFTAEDVKFSYSLAIREGSMNWKAGYFRDIVKNLEIVNPYRIVFHLSKPDWSFIYSMSDLQPFLPINCKKYVETVGEKVAATHPIGTGPFKFVEHKLGSYVKFEAVDKHWRQTPYIKTVVLKLIPEEASRVSMLKAGEIDFTPISYDTLKEVEAAGFKVFKPLSIGLNVVLFGQWLPDMPQYDPTVPWALRDRERARKVRRALAMAIDKQKIIDTLFGGKGEVLKNVIAWPEHQVYRELDLKPIPYDPPGARKLLAEAGYPNGFECTMALSTQTSRPINSPVCEAVAMYWEKNLGLKVKRVNPDWTALKGKITAKGVAGWAWVYPMPYYDTPLEYAQTVGHSRASLVYGQLSHEHDALLDRGMASIEPKKRRAIEREVAQLWDKEVISIPIARVATLIAAHKKIVDWKAFIGYPCVEQYYEYIKFDTHIK